MVTALLDSIILTTLDLYGNSSIRLHHYRLFGVHTLSVEVVISHVVVKHLCNKYTCKYEPILRNIPGEVFRNKKIRNVTEALQWLWTGFPHFQM